MEDISSDSLPHIGAYNGEAGPEVADWGSGSRVRVPRQLRITPTRASCRVEYRSQTQLTAQVVAISSNFTLENIILLRSQISH